MSVTNHPQKANLVAVSLSGLCLCHCLALPTLASLAPALGIFADEWVHQLLVLSAAPISLFVLLKTRQARVRAQLSVIIGLGLTLLFLGAFAESLHDYETPLTVFGALILASTHAFRWRQHRADNYPPEEHL